MTRKSNNRLQRDNPQNIKFALVFPKQPMQQIQPVQRRRFTAIDLGDVEVDETLIQDETRETQDFDPLELAEIEESRPETWRGE